MFVPGAFRFISPTKISSGIKALDNLPSELTSMNAHNPLLLAKPHDGNTGQIEKIINAFRTFDMPIVIIDTPIDPNDGSGLKKIAGIYKDTPCDAIIAAGNGSFIDAAKLINVLVSQPGIDINALSGEAIKKKLGPFVHVPFSGGTGMEATSFVETEKTTVSSCFLMPDMVMLDPRVLFVKDRNPIINASLASLCIAVEAFLADDAGPLVKTYALKAIELIAGYLPLAVKGQKMKTSLLAIANAQVIAGCAFSNTRPGIGFSAARHLSQQCGQPAGLLMAVILPHLLICKKDKHPGQVADLLLPLAGDDAYAMTAAHLKAQKTISTIEELFYEVGRSRGVTLSSSLKTAGADLQAVQAVSEAVKKEMKDPEEVETILNNAFKGAVLY